MQAGAAPGPLAKTQRGSGENLSMARSATLGKTEMRHRSIHATPERLLTKMLAARCLGPSSRLGSLGYGISRCPWGPDILPSR